jgi:hypothetical protein
MPSSDALGPIDDSILDTDVWAILSWMIEGVGAPWTRHNLEETGRYTGEQQTLTISRTQLDEPSEGLALLVVETLRSKINRAEGRRSYYSARPAGVEFSLQLADRVAVLKK